MKIDYITSNFCATCRLTVEKITIRCPDCGHGVRTKARGSKIYN